MGSRRLTFAWLILLLLAAPSLAAATLDVEAGYGNRFRPGRWSPLIITVSNDKPITGLLEIRVANASSSVMKIRQAVGVGPQKQTYVMYAPLSMMFDPARVTLVDAGSRKVLAEWPEDAPGMVNTRFGFGGEQVGFFAVTAGRSPVMQNLVHERGGGISIVSHQPQRFLPTTPIGYDSIDLLFLNNPEWAALSTEQQNAIVGWVRAGGQLMVWPGIEPLPADAPTAAILPCTLGDVTPLALDEASLKMAGLPTRFAALAQRTLTAKPGAQTIALLNARTSAVTQRVGLGSVTVLPFDASTLQFNDTDAFREFWSTLLRQAVDWQPAARAKSSGNTPAAQPMYLDTEDMEAASRALDRIGDIPNTGSFGFSYIVIVVGLMMLVVGPVDFFVLKKIGRQPWTWATTTGWIGLVTVGALFAGHLMRSGDLHYRTMALIEQADEQVVSRNDVALIYAPRSSSYAVEGDPQSWWQPVPIGARYSTSEFSIPLDLHQDYRGTRPEPMWIDVWSYRFLQGKQIVSAPPVVSAKLTRDGNTVRGTITNLGTQALRDMQIELGNRSAAIGAPCGSGETISVNVKLDTSALPLPASSRTERTRRIAMQDSDDNTYGYAALFGIDQTAAGAFKRLKDAPPRERSGPAVLYATIDGASPSINITDPAALQQHQTLLRAIIELQP